MRFASFNVTEVMSHSKFAFKRIGYLAAAQSFDDDTDVLLLTTNQFQKALTSGQQYEIGLALNCLASIVTPDLGRDLVATVATLLNNSHSYVRKKAVLVMYKVLCCQLGLYKTDSSTDLLAISRGIASSFSTIEGKIRRQRSTYVER